MKCTTGTEGGKAPFVEALWASPSTAPSQVNTPAKRAVWADKARKEEPTIRKPNRSLTDQVFGISRYMYSKDGQLYFVHGKTRIKVTEHFSADGKSLNTLLEDVIQFSAQRQNDETRPAC